MARQQVFASV